MNTRDLVLASSVAYYCSSVAKDQVNSCEFELIDDWMGQIHKAILDGEHHRLCHAMPLLVETRRLNYQWKNRAALLEYVTEEVRDMAAMEDSAPAAGSLSMVHKVLANDLIGE